MQGSSQALEIDYRIYLRILALISLSLALLNLLPLLPLDGGHIAFSLVEGIRGRAIPRVAYERASLVGIVLVLMLFFLGSVERREPPERRVAPPAYTVFRVASERRSRSAASRSAAGRPSSCSR